MDEIITQDGWRVVVQQLVNADDLGVPFDEPFVAILWALDNKFDKPPVCRSAIS